MRIKDEDKIESALIDLLSCPFCGGGSNYVCVDRHILGNGTHYIECLQCDLTMEEGFILEEYISGRSKDCRSKSMKRLEKRWNKRV